LPRVKKSARWNSRSIEKCRGALRSMGVLALGVSQPA
jgi:hypothetical protein